MKKFNLQLFDDGGQGGTGAGAGTAGNDNGGHDNAGNGGGYSFQQAEEIANARVERAEKTKPNIDALKNERDAARAELQAMKQAQSENILSYLVQASDNTLMNGLSKKRLKRRK